MFPVPHRKLVRNRLDEGFTDVLQGRERIVSYPGTSQFNGGVSSCGLAAMNFARVLFELIHTHDGRLTDVLRAITSKKVIQDIVSICSGWSSDLHLDVEEDIQRVPLFEKSLKSMSTRFGSPSARYFGHILQEMQTLDDSATVVITRPPEIIACAKIKGSAMDVFVIFDSHPRPIYPAGAGLILSTSIDQTAARLASILPPADSHLLSQGGLQWQAQLLNNVSGHIFVSNGRSGDMREMKQSVIESSLVVLRLQAEVKGLKEEIGRLTSENEVLGRDVQHLENDLSIEKKRVASLQTSSKVLQQSRHVGAGPIKTHPANAIAGPSRLARHYSSSSSSVETSDHDRDSISSPSGASWSGLVNDEWELRSPSTAAALKLQQSFDVEDMQLRNQIQALTATIPRNFSCGICMEELPVDNIVGIDCNHSTCRDCIRGHVSSKLEERRFPILCPICMTERNGREPGVISRVHIQQIGVDEQQYAIWEEMELNPLSVLIHCRKCQRSIHVDRQEHDESRTLVCPLPDCNHTWCKACQQSITSEGPPHSCDGTSELNHLMTQHGWKYCPNCKTPIEKNEGCHHMTCISPGCNTHFCYNCSRVIVRSVVQEEIEDAKTAHYRECRLFDYPDE